MAPLSFKKKRFRGRKGWERRGKTHSLEKLACSFRVQNELVYDALLLWYLPQEGQQL